MRAVSEGTVGTWEGQALVAEALEAPAVYRGLSTEYTDVGRLVEYLGDRLFSGLVRVALPGREGYVLLFRGRPQAARYGVEGRYLEALEAVRALVADSRWMEGEVWVHQLPEELFPEEWEDRPPIPWEAAEALHAHPEEAEGPGVVVPGPEEASREEAPAVAVDLSAQAPPPVEPPSGPDLVSWVRVLESLVARFKRYRGPSAAGRLEAEVNAALQGSGLRLHRGRVEGEVRDAEPLRLATIRAVGFVRGIAGQAFAEQSLGVALKEAGLRDEAEFRRLLAP